MSASGARLDTLARAGDRWLRRAGDVRLGALLLVVAAIWNAAAAAAGGAAWLAAPPYAVLLGAILLSGLAGVATRLPAAWLEWRRPRAVPEGRGAAVAVLDSPLEAPGVQGRLQALGYRVTPAAQGARWAVHGTRRGWSRFAGLASHLALVLVVIGAAVGTAFASETTFSLLPGEQALLDAPRAGFTDAVRLDALDAAFGADGRPRRLDTTVTFLRDGAPVEQRLLQVNAPGSFGGYLVHAWTYGPAVSLRVVTLGDRVVHDGPVALAGTRDGRPAALLELPTAGAAMGVVLADAAANAVAVSVGGVGAAADVALLAPGETARIGDLRVTLGGFSSWVTFLSRRDPGMGLVLGGAALLVASLALALWLPRRRVTVRRDGAALRVVLRGERFDSPDAELARLRAALSA